MNKSFWLKLCVLVLAVSMVVSLAACNGNKTDTTTETPGGNTTEAPDGNKTTEAPDGNTTEAPDGNTTEAPDGNTTEAPDGNTTEAPDGNTTEAPDGNTTEAPDGNTTEAPDGNTTEAPDGNTTEAPDGSQTEGPDACDHVPTKEWKSNGEKHWQECQCGKKHNEADHEGGEWKSDAQTHWKECVCGAKLDEAAHQGGEWKTDTDKHWQECECGVKLEEAVHQGGEWKTDADKHWKECKCGAKLDEAAHDHSGEWKVDAENHWKECVCGLKANEAAHDHSGEWKTNARKHWKECVCGAKLDEAAHEGGEWKTDADKHWKECECGEKLGEAAHEGGEWKTDADKHWKECECGEKLGEAAHDHSGEWKTDDEKHWKECVCGLKANEEEHDRSGEWQTDANNHWKECACGKVDEAAHVADDAEINEDGDALVYKCRDCDKVLYSVEIAFAVGADVGQLNWFSAPSNEFVHWFKGGEDGSIGTDGNVNYDAENDVVYTRVDLSTKSWKEFEILNGTGTPELNTPTQTLYGTGRYLVMKIRVGAGVTDSLNFIAIDGKDSNKTVNNSWIYNPNGRTAWITDEWAVYVIDMSQFDRCGAYDKTFSNSETKALFSFQNRGNKRDNAYIDFAYFAVCDDLREICALVGDEQIVLTSYKDNKVTKQAVCTDHAYSYIKVNPDDTDLVYGCALCGYVENDEPVFTVGLGDNINYYAAPSTQFVHWYKGSDDLGTEGNINYDSENDVVYTRIDLSTKSWKEFEILNGTADPVLNTPSQTLYGTGRYLVMKVRVGSGVTDNLSFVAMDNLCTNKTVNNGWIYNQLKRNTWVTDEWAVYVIDMSLVNVSGAYDKTNFPDIETVSLFGFQNTGNARANAYVDFAYFAVCDSWAEIKTIVDDEQIILTTYGDNSITKTDLADHSDPVVEE